MKKLLALLLSVLLIMSSFGMVSFAIEKNVAKVGDTEYATIDEAIAAWTNGTTLTLLDDVTLSDMVELKSTEHHILNLGSYTITAASNKDAFVIKAFGTGSAEKSALTINADATNPGGIDAGKKRVIYYKYADGGISTEDRPIIKINNGVFTGATSSLGTCGIQTIGTAARKCATLNIAGGIFNCSIYGQTKSKLIISGGTFNYSVGSQGDSTCLRLISGGTFKSFGFMTADSNNTKFWIGTSMGNSNVGTYIDDNGYLVVGGPVITEAGETFEASSTNLKGWNSSGLLDYSSAKNNGLYYTSVEEALADNNKSSGNVTVYVDELDMSKYSTYSGTIIAPEGQTVTITNAPEGLKTQGDVIIVKPAAKIGDTTYNTLVEAVAAANEGDTIVLLSDVVITSTVKVTADKKLTLDLNGYAIDGTEKVKIALMTYGDVTLKDSSAEQTGIIKAGIGTAGNAVNVCGGTFTMESGSIYSKNNALLIDEEACVVNINGGKITAETTTNNSSVMYISSTSNTVVNVTDGELVGFNGILLWNNTEINISGGSLTGKTGPAIQGNGSRDNTKISITGGEVYGEEVGIYHPQGGELTISGNATVTGSTGVVVKGGNVTIAGGTINAFGEAVDYAPVSSGFKGTGDALYVEHYDNSPNSENYGTPVVTVTGGTFNSANGKAIGSYANTNNNVEALEGFVTGGVFSSDVSELCSDDVLCLADENGGYYILSELKGSGTAEDPYQIGSVADWIMFAKKSQKGNSFSGKFVALTADIDFAGGNYLEIAEDGTIVTDYRIPKFNGTFDGKGYTVKNFNYVVKNSGANNIMMFSQDNMWAYIKNLNIENVTATIADISGQTRVTALANRINAGGMTSAAVENVHVKNFKIISNNTTSDDFRIGGFAYFTQGSQLVIKDSSITGFEVDVNSAMLIGGAVAVIKSDCDFENVDVIDAVLSVDKVNKSGGVAGFTVQTQSGGSNATFTDCDVKNVQINIGNCVNNVGGFIDTIGAVSKFNNCTVTGKIVVTDDTNALSIGGFTGDLGWNGMGAKDLQHEFNNCVADVDIIAVNANVGGFIGDSTVAGNQALFMPGYFTNCVAKGDVKTENGVAGGFVGRGDRGVFTNCSASGNVEGIIAGGFWGEIYPKSAAETKGSFGLDKKDVTHIDENSKTIVLDGIEATGTVSGTDYEAGLVGFMKDIYVNDDDTLGYATPVVFGDNKTTDYNRHNYPTDAVDPVVMVAKIGENTYTTLEAALEAAVDGDIIKIIADVNLDATIKNTKNITIDLNGHTISGVDTTDKSFGLIYNNGALTINDTVGTGKITLSATIDSGWNRYSSVISNNPGGKLIVNGGTIEHLGGTAMAYAIDNLTNGKSTYAETVINDGTIKSTYAGIRQFLNGVEAQNILTINGGTVMSDNRAIFFQDPSANANSGTLTITADAKIYGKVHLSVTEGSTEWPVEVSVAAEALQDGSAVTNNYLPEGYVIENKNGTYGVAEKTAIATVDGVEYEDLQAAIDAANGKTVVIVADIALESTIKVVKDTDVTIDLNGHTISGVDTTSKSFGLIYNNGTLTINDTVGTGKITLSATIDSGWNRYSSVISNNPGGKLIVNGGTIEHLGGTAMAYAIDNLTNGKGTYAETVINDGTIKSTYAGIRQFLNGVEAQNILTINGGTVKSDNRAIFFQDPSKNANSGTLTIAADAAIYGKVHLSVTEGSTEWPVEVSVAAEALQDGSAVTNNYLPKGYVIENNNGIYGVAEEPEVEEPVLPGRAFYIINMPKDDKGNFQVGIYHSIDSLNYREVGFEVYNGNTGNLVASYKTTTVFESMKVTQTNGSVVTVNAKQLGGNYIFGIKAHLPTSWDNIPIQFKAYAIDMDGNKIYGYTYEIPDVYTK